MTVICIVVLLQDITVFHANLHIWSFRTYAHASSIRSSYRYEYQDTFDLLWSLSKVAAFQIVEEKMDIRGGYAKPTIKDILWIQLMLLPWTMCKWAYFYGRWCWKFGIFREEYGDEEKLYIIRKNLGLSQGQFDVSY